MLDALVALAGALALDTPTSRPLTEVESLKLEAGLLRRQLAQRDLDDAQNKLVALISEACRSVGVERMEDCTFDTAAKTVGRKAPVETKR